MRVGQIVLICLFLCIGACSRDTPETESRLDTQVAAAEPAVDSFYDPMRTAQTRAALPRCEGAALVTSDSLGPFFVGITRAQVLARCPMAESHFEFAEGDFYPMMAVRLGEVAISLTFDGDSAQAPAYNVVAYDAGARTADGIGPGSLLSSVAARYGPLSFGDNECALYAWGPGLPGVSWGVASPADWDCVQVGAVNRPGGTVLPDSTRVTSVVVRRRSD